MSLADSTYVICIFPTRLTFPFPGLQEAQLRSELVLPSFSPKLCQVGFFELLFLHLSLSSFAFLELLLDGWKGKILS